MSVLSTVKGSLIKCYSTESGTTKNVLQQAAGGWI
jgi:hypothetical protein